MNKLRLFVYRTYTGMADFLPQLWQSSAHPSVVCVAMSGQASAVSQIPQTSKQSSLALRAALTHPSCAYSVTRTAIIADQAWVAYETCKQTVHLAALTNERFLDLCILCLATDCASTSCELSELIDSS